MIVLLMSDVTQVQLQTTLLHRQTRQTRRGQQSSTSTQNTHTENTHTEAHTHTHTHTHTQGSLKPFFVCLCRSVQVSLWVLSGSAGGKHTDTVIKVHTHLYFFLFFFSFFCSFCVASLSFFILLFSSFLPRYFILSWFSFSCLSDVVLLSFLPSLFLPSLSLYLSFVPFPLVGKEVRDTQGTEICFRQTKATWSSICAALSTIHTELDSLSPDSNLQVECLYYVLCILTVIGHFILRSSIAHHHSWHTTSLVL